MNIEEAVLENGFTSPDEFFSMVAKVDLTSAEKLQQFKTWQNNDGTKAGLEKLINGNEN